MFEVLPGAIGPPSLIIFGSVIWTGISRLGRDYPVLDGIIPSGTDCTKRKNTKEAKL